LATSLFGLVPGAPVEVEITFIRESTIDGTVLEVQRKSGIVSTRSDAFPSTGSTWFVAPSGDDGTGDGSYGNPWRSPRGASSRTSLQPGDTIVLKSNEQYGFFDVDDPYVQDDVKISSSNAAPFTSKSGTASAYITLKAETPGTVKIRGSKALNLSWTAYEVSGTHLYPHCYKSTTPVSERLNRMRFKANPNDIGTILYPYKDLVESGSGQDAVFGLADRPWLGWFQDASGYLYVKLDDGAEPEGIQPQNNQLTAAAANSGGLYLFGVEYWKIEGIVFEDFGTQTPEHGIVNHRGIDIRGAKNIVIDGCTFRESSVWSSFAGQTPPAPNITSENVTVQNCRFEASGIWEVCDDRFDPAGWSYGKLTPLNVTHIFMESTRGGVVRRNSFDGSYYGVVIGTGRAMLTGGAIDEGGDVDIHGNTFTKISGDNIAVDYADVAVGDFDQRMTRIFLNDSTLTNFGFSFSPMNVGPVFCVANKAIDFVSFAFKQGNGSVGNPSARWKFLYHNAIKSGISGSIGFGVNLVTGNIVAVNNVLQGEQRVIVGDVSAQMMPAPNAFIRNALFSTNATTPHQLAWRGNYYQKNPPTHLTAEQSLMDPFTGEPAAHPNELVFFDRNIEELNPFPNGGDTGLNPALEAQAVAIPGITNIAGAAGGVHLPEPLAIGRFGSFAMPPRATSTTATLTRRLIPMIMRQQTPQTIS
jgi:hypothetical protein